MRKSCSFETGSPQGQKALNRLLILIQQLPGLYRSSHPDYLQAFNRTLEWVAQNLKSFVPRQPSVEKSLVVWINGYLRTKEELNDAKTRGFKLKQEAVAIDAIALVVHPSLNVDGLTLEEVKDIYTGKIANWQEVGGPNLKITPYYRPMESGTTPFFKENVLASQEFGKNAVLVDNTTEGLQKVGQAEDVGGIYFASAPEVVPQCSSTSSLN